MIFEFCYAASPREGGIDRELINKVHARPGSAERGMEASVQKGGDCPTRELRFTSSISDRKDPAVQSKVIWSYLSKICL